jgi:hypothetical protein
MNPDHPRYADWDSAYVLGALSPGERREYEVHLETCETCRRSVAELAPMPGLLARLPADRAEALLDEPVESAPAPRPELLDAVRREGRRRRLRRTRARIALAVAAAMVVLAAVAVPLALMRPATEREALAFEALADVPVSASAVLSPADWGTRIELDCTYDAVPDADVPDRGWPYALVVVDRDGERTEVSSWRAMPGETARLEAGTSLDLGEIAVLEIHAVASGELLLRASTD